MNTLAFLCHAAAVPPSYQPRWAWLLGGAVAVLAVGLEWRPGPWRESPATHSSLVVSLLAARLVIEHAQTRIHTRG